jgi:hypothetical protein
MSENYGSKTSSETSRLFKKMEEAPQIRNGEFFLQKLSEVTKRLNDLCSEFDPQLLSAGASISEEGSMQPRLDSPCS